MNPNVLIAVGTCDKFSYCEEVIFKRIFTQVSVKYDVLIVDNSSSKNYYNTLKIKYPTAKIIHIKRALFFRQALAEVRQAILNYTRANGYAYLFCVDADMLIDPKSLSLLIEHKKKFVTGLIGYHHNPKNETTVWTGDFKRTSNVPGLPYLVALKFSDKNKKPSFMEIVACGLSCCLIHSSVLFGMNFYFSHKTRSFLEDFIFCRDLKQKGVKLYLDKRVAPIHLHVKMNERNLRDPNGRIQYK